MKYAYFFLALALLSSCNPNSKKGESSSIETDTLSLATASTEIDTLSINDLDSALLVPEKVVRLKLEPSTIDSKLYQAKHLPELGSFFNLKKLEMHFLANLEDLPFEIGKLKNLERIEIDNGNGGAMNISIPSSIDQLQNLKVLILYGAIDSRIIGDSIRHVKELPKEFGNLNNLEVLDLGRNGLTTFPPQLASLTNLKVLKLAYNEIAIIPSSISQLKNLQMLELSSNGRIELPNSLSEFKNLTVYMGNSYLKLKDQQELRTRFPNLAFDFSNEYMDGAANETGEEK
jgi:Leucine-rich repeat (LRR) protein